MSGHLSNKPSLNKPSVLCPRAAESSACPTIHPKQAKTEKAVAQDHAENGECLAESRESKEFQIAAAEAMAAATPTAKSSSGKDAVQQGGSQASLQEEDPERMKHSKIRARGYTGSGAQRGVSRRKGLCSNQRCCKCVYERVQVLFQHADNLSPQVSCSSEFHWELKNGCSCGRGVSVGPVGLEMD